MASHSFGFIVQLLGFHRKRMWMCPLLMQRTRHQTWKKGSWADEGDSGLAGEEIVVMQHCAQG